MDKNHLKAIRLSAELIKYFVSCQIPQMEVGFTFTATGFAVMVSGLADEEPADFPRLKSALQASRQPEIDEYYEQLICIDSPVQDFHLLGAMIDEGEATYENGRLTVRVSRVIHRQGW